MSEGLPTSHLAADCFAGSAVMVQPAGFQTQDMSLYVYIPILVLIQLYSMMMEHAT